MTDRKTNNSSSPGRLADPPSYFNVDNSLSQELLKLSFNDRIAIEEEIHGVRCGAAEETPELLERSLREFDSELIARKEGDPENRLLKNVISISSKAATAGSNCYLNNPGVRLRFLRCERFAVKQAVERFVNFLEFTSELFGDFVAERPIRLSDFNTNKEQTALKNSRNQYLPFRDRSGRRVLVGVGACAHDLDPVLRFKIIMYLHWIGTEDIETQQKGIVMIAWPFNEGDDASWEKSYRPGMNNKLRSFFEKLFKAMPVRMTSQHFCFEDTPFYRALSTLFFFGLDSHYRSIYKDHYGEPTELRYTLSSFGIPTDMLPLSYTGTVKTATHSRWINAVRANMDREQDGDEKEEEIVECPRTHDVVFRKGTTYSTYKNIPGNMYYRELIMSTSDQHMKAKKKEKYEITWRIVKKIEERNGRCLEWSKSKDSWIVITDREEIRKKIAAGFKHYKHAAQKQDALQEEDATENTNTDHTKNTEQHMSQTSQLDNAITNAAALLVLQQNVSQYSNFPKINSENESLKHYYSVQHAYYSKRRKLLFCGYNTSDKDSGSNDDDGFCFGRSFFPTK